MKTQSNYYPYGEVWLEPEGQPWLYSGNERLREDGINEYDFNARRYNSALGLFTTWDPLAEKRPWDSPYAFCAGDPVNYSDPTGLTLDLTSLLLFDKVSHLGITQRIIDQLIQISGLSLLIDEKNCLKYATNEFNNPIVAQSERDGKLINLGSAEARNLLINAINAEESISVGLSKSSAHDNIQNILGINYQQIEKFINGAVGIDGNTMGYGMTFLHELCHTILCGNLHDSFGQFETGEVVDKINNVRKELNDQGFNYGCRMTYSSFQQGKYAIIPFDKESLLRLGSGNDNLTGTKYIKYKIK